MTNARVNESVKQNGAINKNCFIIRSANKDVCFQAEDPKIKEQWCSHIKENLNLMKTAISKSLSTDSNQILDFSDDETVPITKKKTV